MAQIQTRKTGKKPVHKVVWEFPLVKKNWMILAVGAATIIIGYLLMATAITDDPQKHQEIWNNAMAISIAPIVLVIGFLVIIPYGLFWREKETATESDAQ